MNRPSDVIDGVLSPARGRPVRLYSLIHTGGYLAEWVLDIREWHSLCHWAEPVQHLYGVQWLGECYGMIRLNPLPLVTLAREFDDGSDDDGRLFRVLMPCKSDRGQCSCKGWHTFRQCRHLAAMVDVIRTQERYLNP